MIIREAKPGDEEGIARVHVLTWQTAYRGIYDDAYLDGLSVEKRIQSWGEYLRQNNPAKGMLLAQENDEIVGFVSMCPARLEGSSPEMGEVSTIYVHPEHQRKGIGKKLLLASFEWFKQKGYKQILVQTADASKFKHFYANQGGILQSHKMQRTAKNGQIIDMIEYRWKL